jgi:hypothetical protein
MFGKYATQISFFLQQSRNIGSIKISSRARSIYYVTKSRIAYLFSLLRSIIQTQRVSRLPTPSLSVHQEAAWHGHRCQFCPYRGGRRRRQRARGGGRGRQNAVGGGGRGFGRRRAAVSQRSWRRARATGLRGRRAAVSNRGGEQRRRKIGVNDKRGLEQGKEWRMKAGTSEGVRRGDKGFRSQ